MFEVDIYVMRTNYDTDTEMNKQSEEKTILDNK